MSKKIEVLFGFLVIVIVIVGFIIAGIATIPNNADVTSAMTDTNITAPADITKLKVFNQIKQLDRNGQIPVQVNSTELGRPNPFLPI